MENLNNYNHHLRFQDFAKILSALGYGTVSFIKEMEYKQVQVYALYKDPKEMTLEICQELIAHGVFPCAIFKESLCVLLVADIGYKNYLEEMYHRECIMAEEGIKKQLGRSAKYMDDMYLEELARNIVNVTFPLYGQIQELIKI